MLGEAKRPTSETSAFLLFHSGALLLLARPFAPAIAIAYKDGVCRLNIRPCIVRRTGCLWCTVPGAGIENLEDASGMTPTNRDGIVCIGVQARFTLSDTQCLWGIGAKCLRNHRRHRTRGLAGWYHCRFSRRRCDRWRLRRGRNTEYLTWEDQVNIRYVICRRDALNGRVIGLPNIAQRISRFHRVVTAV